MSRALIAGLILSFGAIVLNVVFGGGPVIGFLLGLVFGNCAALLYLERTGA